VAKAQNKAAASQPGRSNRWEINRKRKLEKQLKLQPNNEQVKMALLNIRRRRKTPNTQEWSKSWIRMAKLFKMFAGRFDRDIMSSNQLVAAAALQKPSKVATNYKQVATSDKNFFSIAARLKGGNLV
jgi:hypothetical protein